jgi:Peptidase A4 family/Putative Ig domain/IPT/TIG domain
MPVDDVASERRYSLPALACVCMFALLGAVFPFRAVASAATTRADSAAPRAALTPLHGAHLPAVHPIDATHLRRVSLSTRPHSVGPGAPGPGVEQASALHPTEGIVPGGGVRNDVYSTNWSGQILAGASYSGVGGDWTVPAVAASASDEYSATWIGVDGTTASSLIQTGTAQQYVDGAAQYYAWVELLPGNEGVIGNVSGPAPVDPGDQIAASVVETTANMWAVTIDDVTQSWGFSQTFSYTTPGASVEWIEEAPTVNDTQSTLANFDTATFTGIGADESAASTLVPVYMLDPTGTYIIAYPGTYNSGSFSDFYGTPPPTVTSVTPNQGYTTGGTIVTISGSFLIGATAVDFGTTPAVSPTFNDNTLTLTADSPAESQGTVDVTVTTPGGTSALSASDQFTYSPPPPIISTTSLPPGTVGSAYSGMLAATSGTPGYTWSITSSSPPAWLSLDPATGALTGTPTSSGTFPVTFEVIDTNSLSGSATLTISVFSDPGVYVPLAPVRVCDTRAGNPSHLSGAAAQCSNGTAGSTLAANGTMSFSVAGNFGVPSSTVTAVVLNVTATGAKAAGYLTVYPAGANRPTASNLNYVPGEALPNLVEVGLGTGGQISVFSPSATDVVVDLEGYVTTTTQSGAGLYNALSTPSRICDTRGSNPSHLTGGATQCNTDVAAGGPDDRVTPAGPLTVTVDGNGGVPASGVSAVVLNVTVTRPTAPGYVTAYPADQPQPVASNVNYAAGETVANRVTVPVSGTGQITLYAAAPTDVVVDVSGWYTAAGGTTGSEFTPEVAPVRICDTRGSNPSHLVTPNTQCNTNVATGSPANPLLAGTARILQASGLADMPSGATAAVLNVTDVAPSAASYLTVYLQGTPPTTSDVNPPVGGVAANFTVATLTGTGTFDVIDQGSGTAQLVVDVGGWYTTPA